MGEDGAQSDARPLLVLTATDPATLRAIRADWRLRPLLENAISPHHLVVRAGRSAELCRRLERRGHAVTRAERSADPPTPAAAEYLYLAARVYQQLGGIAPAEVHLPGEVARQAAASLDPAQIDALDQTAAAYVDKLRQTLSGRLVGQGGVAQDEPEGIRAALRIACEQRSSVTIVYFSPAHGAETTRTIEPKLLYERNGAAYVEAWCQLDGDTRTFRVDRIVRIVEPAILGADVLNVGEPAIESTRRLSMALSAWSRIRQSPCGDFLLPDPRWKAGREPEMKVSIPLRGFFVA